MMIENEKIWSVWREPLESKTGKSALTIGACSSAIDSKISARSVEPRLGSAHDIAPRYPIAAAAKPEVHGRDLIAGRTQLINSWGREIETARPQRSFPIPVKGQNQVYPSYGAASAFACNEGRVLMDPGGRLRMSVSARQRPQGRETHAHEHFAKLVRGWKIGHFCDSKIMWRSVNTDRFDIPDAAAKVVPGHVGVG
jgi:hypothetical protein